MNKDDTQQLSLEKLQERNKFLETILNLSSAIIYIYDIVNQKNLYSNDGIESVLGYSAQEISNLGSRLFPELMHPEDFQVYLHETLHRYNGAKDNERITSQFRMKHKDGMWRWLQSTESIYSRDSKGAPTQVYGVINDITQQKLVEESLRETQLILQAAMDQSEAGIAIADSPSGKLRYVNDSGLLIRGGTRENVVKGVSVDDYVSSWQRLDLDGRPLKREEVPLARAVLFGETNSREFIIRRSENDDRIVLAKAAPIRDSQGMVIAGIVVFMDITDRKKTELALSQSEYRLRQALENAPFPIMIHSDNGKIEFINSIWTTLTGYTHAEIPTIESWVAKAYGTQKNAVKNEIDGLYGMTDRKDEGHYVINTSEGNTLIWDFSSASLGKLPDGSQAVISMAKDVTSSIKMEEELQKSLRLESLGILAGGIAHDFNNLMSGIFGYIDLAKERTKEPKVSTDLTKALGTIDRARALTHQLLTFAKGGVPSKKVENLKAFVQDNLLFVPKDSKARIQFRFEKDLWPCNIDRKQIEQTVEKIVSNALEAMPKGGEIEVSALNLFLTENQVPALTAGKYVKLSIKDQGVGIEKDVLPKIFDPFFTTKPKGHGLGLSICYSIVNRHDGSIEVESEPGKGSSFHLYLPAFVDYASEQ